MFRWLKERRAANADADAVLAELLRQQAAAGGTVASSGVAVEQAAGLWARAFASAKVEPETPATRSLTPSVLAHIGRMLALQGECVLVIDADERGLRLAIASAWQVLRGWRYRVDVPMPERTATRTLPAEGVVHPRYAVKQDAPWKGLSPLAFAPNTGDLAGRVDLSLSREFRTPTGCVIFGSAEANPLTEEQAAKLGERLSQGHLVSIGQSPRDVSPATGYAGDAGWLPPNSNPVAGRIGPEPPASVSELRSGVSADILAAFGVPPTIYAPNAASAREGWREFLHGTIAPIGKLVAEELEAKLGAQGVRFDFHELQASDVSGRSRAFRSLVDAGMDIGEARKVAGV